MNDADRKWIEREAKDAEASRDAQWASGDRAFAEMNDARAAAFREVLAAGEA